MDTPARFSPESFGSSLPRKEDYDDSADDADIVYEPLEDAAWVDEEDLNAIEVVEDETELPAAPAEPAVNGAPASEPAAPKADLPAAHPASGAVPQNAPAAACLYRVVIPLTDDLREEIAAVRGAHALEGAAPGALVLIPPFRSEESGALGDALRVWAVERLPLEVTLNAIAAEVIGARRYVAGWALAPAGRITAAQQALARALSDLIQPCEEAPDPFEPRIVVADPVPPPVFPHLIADMQRFFEPRRWTIASLALEEAAPGGRAPRWTARLTLP